MKSTKTNKSGVGGVQQFLIWHGEKIAVGIVVVVALWFAMQGLGYQALTWQPSDLERDAEATQTAIRDSTRTAEDEDVAFPDPDHATFAQQIRNPIPTEPYRTGTLWNSNGFSTSQQTGARAQSSDY